MSTRAAILDDDTLKCWGHNAFGALGIELATGRIGNTAGQMATLPTINVGTGRTVRAVAAGGNHTCVILDDASVKCWGYTREALARRVDGGDVSPWTRAAVIRLSCTKIKSATLRIQQRDSGSIDLLGSKRQRGVCDR